MANRLIRWQDGRQSGTTLGDDREEIATLAALSLRETERLSCGYNAGGDALGYREKPRTLLWTQIGVIMQTVQRCV